MDQPLTYRLDDGVAVVTMDDGKANALSAVMLDALTAALAHAEAEAKALVLAGRPDRFCGGFDLKQMMANPASATALLRQGGEVLMKLYGTPLPLVIACTGHALAGGALLVLTGDYRIGARGDYKLGLNEVAIGLPVPVLAMELARDRLSKRALARATLLAEIFDPDAAHAVGYLDAVTAAADVVPRAIAEARRLGGHARRAFTATKQRLRKATIDHVRATSEADLRELLSPG